MIHLNAYYIIEIFLGAFFLWTGIYLLSRNPYSKLAWVVFGFLFAIGFSLGTDPILSNSRTIAEYVLWQKITDWTLFLSPVLCFHASLLIRPGKNKLNNYLLILGYFLAISINIIDIKWDMILRRDVVRMAEYRRFDGFAPGPLLIPTVIFTCGYFALSIGNFLKEIREGFYKYSLPILAIVTFLATGALTIAAFYIYIPKAPFYFTLGFSGATLLFIYSIIKYHLFAPAEKIIFDRNFLYKSIGVILILALYTLVFFFSRVEFSFPVLVFTTFLIILVLFTHSFYDWLSTFINDFLFNFSSGLSIVSDKEVNEVLKNYNDPEKLEDSTLLKLNIIRKTIKGHKLPVDGLRDVLKDAVEYFSPEENIHRRTKQNLKYHLLKMLVFDQAEEGQILWELGFDEYPVRILSRENKTRPPLFQIDSPSDYTYKSRNAFIALKKEAIHNVAWRISYFEKLSKEK